MSSLANYEVAFCSAVLLGLQVAAQTPTFHLELADGSLGYQTLVLVNDLDKPISIEAMHLTQRCPSGGSYGALDFWDDPIVGQDNVIHLPEGSTISHKFIEIDPGGKWQTGFSLMTLTSSKGVVEKCEPKIDAVFFTDGSHEGKDEAVRSLKARRDGISASVGYWSDRLNGEDPKKSDLEALRIEAECLVDEDRATLFKYPFVVPQDDSEPLLNGYWSGRLYADMKVLAFLPERPEPKNFSELSNLIVWWKKRFDTNIASKKLDIEFPWLSEPTGTCNPNPAK